tara:strand:+ start:16044 stop:17090 length:1047 start_codon:yes stop_codon:yes gene_type:complete
MAVNLTSDNVSGASPSILEALVSAGTEMAMPYGNDKWTIGVEKKLSQIFETELVTIPVSTGTASNALALSALTPPYGAIYCHSSSHAYKDECGAPEFYSGGAKMIPLEGKNGKISEVDLKEKLKNSRPNGVHNVLPAALTLSQATEFGTIYSTEEIQALTKTAHEHSMMVHMDGARFANSLVQQNISPADATWKSGIDVLSLGATKNGALAAEVIIFFKTELANKIPETHKRGGHLLSKMRFITCQLDAYLTNDLWKTNASNANNAAKALAEGLNTFNFATLKYPVEANEIFVSLPEYIINKLEKDGFGFYRIGNQGVIRLVTSFNTDVSDVDTFLSAINHHSKHLKE